MKLNINKKASQMLGIGIMAIAVIFLLVAILQDTNLNVNEKEKYLQEKTKNNIENYPYENYLFYLNKTNIGKQNIIRESYPNIELGSIEEYKTTYIANNIELKSNPFTKTKVNLRISPTKSEDLQKLMIYSNPEILSGNKELLIYINGKIEAQIDPKTNNFPVALYNLPKTNNITNKSFTITLELVKPKLYSLFSWNKVNLEDFRIVEVNRDEENNIKEFNFQINKENLNKANLDITISCEKNEERSPAIEIKINDYIIANQNPKCTSRYNTITANIPLNILNENKNTLELKTSGYYKIAYSINKVYYNDQQKYKFSINSFNDIIDVVMYGEFDKQSIDIRLNSQPMELRRNEIKSIIPYLRFGINEIEFLNKPLEIEEFIIEKNEFLDFE